MTPNTRHSTLLTKVPEVTAIFWLTKVLTTGVGESTSDFLVKQVGKGGAVFLGTIAFAGALIWQFKTSRYTPGVYWLAVAMVAVFGTLAADAVHVGLGVPYYASSTLYAAILAAIFVAWYRTEGTLSIYSIDTPRREVFYWLAVLATFALGNVSTDIQGLGTRGALARGNLSHPNRVTTSEPRAGRLQPNTERNRTMATQSGETPILDLLASMTAGSVESTNLDPRSLMLVRIAALVAVDAPPASYMLNLGAAGELGVTADDIEGLLTAVAPIVGTTRIVSAVGKLVRAFDLKLELGALEQYIDG